MSILKEFREAKGYTQKQLADYSKVSLKSLQKYETGERDIAKAEAATVCRLAHVLNVSVDELIGYNSISYETLEEQINKYDYDEFNAINFCIGYCGMVDNTIYDMIFEILKNKKQA